MEDYTAQELFELLNETDECIWIEAKGMGDSSRSIMETVCAYANEPGLGGGYILLNISAEDTISAPIQYKVDPLLNPDKIQSDLATQCACMFNIPVRPKISIEKINGLTALKMWIDELPAKQKPLYFKKDKLPYGAMRRIGSTDQRCTEDDMHVFYQDTTSFEQTPVKGTTLADVDEHALKRYRFLREKVNPAAEELSYNDSELLQALGCVNKENPNELNIAGLMLFGSSKIQRSTFPMMRADYIRVQGNTWISNPDDRFTTIDMRGPLLLMLYRLIDAVNADLPKGFLLPEDDLQATSTGLPLRALREAITNALMHRSLREHRPIQIIRYDNRIEIINPGFSLKPTDKLGLPGSETRNPFIAAVFHDTNLAETKGSGIRTMQQLMAKAHLAPPTFESSRENNEFVSRLLLHHFLDEKDLKWLIQFENFDLSDNQKKALIFVREVEAIDNASYRQISYCDVSKASSDLRKLKGYDLLISKGKGRATYYVPGISTPPHEISTPPHEINTPPHKISTPPHKISTPPHEISTPPRKISTPPHEISTPPRKINTPPHEISTPPLKISTPPHEISTPPPEIFERIKTLNKREHNKRKVEAIIMDLCSHKPIKATEIAGYFQKDEPYFKRKYLTIMIKEKKLRYLHPEMINHPKQAYITNIKQN